MKRFTETAKWSDPWFRGLSTDCKLAFLYIIDNCDNAGFWEIDLGMMAFQTGIDERGLQGALKGLARGLVVSDGWLWVRNFLRHQKNDCLKEINPAHKQIIAILREQEKRFDFISDFLSERGLHGPSKGLLSPIGNGTGNGSSLTEGDARGNRKRYATFEEVCEFGKGQPLPISQECMDSFFDRMEEIGWTDDKGLPLADWRARFRRYATNWINNRNQPNKP